MAYKHPMVGKRRKCTTCQKRRVMVASLDKARTQWLCIHCTVQHMMTAVGEIRDLTNELRLRKEN